ncbi:outer dynein arm protein 1-like [Tachysurus ichikawai]
MIRGKIAKNISSDSDIGALEEKTRLQRKYRILMGDLEAARIHTQEYIHKQWLEIDVLCKQHMEVQEKLNVSQSQPYRQSDRHCGQQLQALLKRCDQLDKDMESERLIQVKRKQEIQCIQKELEYSKLKFQAQELEEFNGNKLENKLEHTQNCINMKMAKKHQLKKEVDKLHMDRVQFQQLHRNLDKELQKIQRDINDVVDITMAAQNEREKAHMKMMMMMKEKKRIDEFMATEYREWTGLDDALSHRHEMKEKCWTDSEVSEEDLKELFRRLQEVINEEDLDMLVTKLFQGEERNFNLYKYLNEQNATSEGLKHQITELKEKIEEINEEDRKKEQEHQNILKQMKEQWRDTKAQTLEYQTRTKQVTESLDQIYTGVKRVFDKINCDREALDDMLCDSSGIKYSSVMIYLKMVEEKIDELLAIQNFIKSKVQVHDPELSEEEKQTSDFEPPSLR